MHNLTPPPKAKIVRGPDGKLRTVEDRPTVTEADLARTRREVHDAIHGHVPFHDDPMAKPEGDQAPTAVLANLEEAYREFALTGLAWFCFKGEELGFTKIDAPEVYNFDADRSFYSGLQWEPKDRQARWSERISDLLYMEFCRASGLNCDEQASDGCPSLGGALLMVSDDEP